MYVNLVLVSVLDLLVISHMIFGQMIVLIKDFNMVLMTYHMKYVAIFLSLRLLDGKMRIFINPLLLYNYFCGS